MDQVKQILATQMQRIKVKNPLVFVAIIAGLYGYTFLIDTGSTLDLILGVFGEDINSVPNGIMQMIEKSKYLTGAALALIGGHTTDILKEAKN